MVKLILIEMFKHKVYIFVAVSRYMALFRYVRLEVLSPIMVVDIAKLEQIVRERGMRRSSDTDRESKEHQGYIAGDAYFVDLKPEDIGELEEERGRIEEYSRGDKIKKEDKLKLIVSVHEGGNGTIEHRTKKGTPPYEYEHPTNRYRFDGISVLKISRLLNKIYFEEVKDEMVVAGLPK